MSRANGTVYLRGEPAAYFLWDGGAGQVATGELFDTKREAWADAGKVPHKCTCGKRAVEVLLSHDYGKKETFWQGSACFLCEAIVGGRIPYEDELEVER